MNFQSNTEGIFPSLPEDVYRAAPGISQSEVKSFAAEPTPAHYKASLEEPDEPSAAMEFGTVLHAHILQPEKAGTSFHLRPAAYPGKDGPKPWHGGAEWCKQWMASHDDRPVLKLEAVDRIAPIVARVVSIPEAGSVLVNGQREVSFFKRDKETGLLLKARVDAIATDADGVTWLVDLKKVRRGFASEAVFADEVVRRGYHVQAASYMSITGASKFIFVAMEAEPPFEVQQHSLDEEFIELGYAAWRLALRRYAECLAMDSWPGYAAGIRRLNAPRWAVRKAIEV